MEAEATEALERTYHSADKSKGEAGSSLLLLSAFNAKGQLEHGQVLPRLQRQLGLSGDARLARFSFAARSLGRLPAALPRGVSRAPGTDDSKSYLDFNTHNGLVTWNYSSTGDYNQDSLVSISDLTPLAIHFGESAGGSTFDQDSLLRQIDGDGNGEINISDVTPIGQNFGRLCQGYMVFQSDNLDDIPAGNEDESVISRIDSVGFASAVGDPALQRLSFSYQPTTIPSNTFFWVRPYDATEEPTSQGTPSYHDGPLVFTFAEGTIALGPPSGVEWIGSAGELLVLDDPPGEGEVEEGSVLVGVYHDNVNDIYTPLLRRVTTIVSNDGQQKQVATEPANISDFLLGGGFGISSDLIAGKLIETTEKLPCAVPSHAGGLDDGGGHSGDEHAEIPHSERYTAMTPENCPPEDMLPSWTPADQREASAEGDLAFDFSGQVLYDTNDGAGNYIRVVASEGLVQIVEPGLFLDYDVGVKWCESFIGIDYPCGVGLKYFRAGVGGGFVSDLEVEATGHYASSFTEERSVFEYKKPILIFIGPVPVLITLVIKLHVGVSGNGSIDFRARTGYHANYALSAGVEYNGGWGTFYEPPTGFEPVPPEIHMNGEMAFNAYARCEFEVRLYEIVGGNVSLQPGLELIGSGSVDSGLGVYCVNWDLNGKARSDLRLFAEIFGISLFDQSWNLIDTGFDITDGHIGCGDSLPPNVYFGGTSGMGNVPVTVFYNAEGDGSFNPDFDTFDPDGGAIQSYHWDLDGDGYCELDTGNVGLAQHTYNQYGALNVSVWVTDDEGAVVQKTIGAEIVKPPS